MIIISVHPGGHTDLMQVIAALRAPGSLLGARQHGQQQARQNSDNDDDHQKLDQSKGGSGFRLVRQGP